jgi:hypothetical protein
MVGDVNGDGKDDVVGCTLDGVLVALAREDGFGFDPPAYWSSEFSMQSAYAFDATRHRRKLVDVNGDGQKDLVGFHDQEVIVAKSRGSSFAPAETWLYGLGYSEGWMHPQALILFGDVDGAFGQDILAFGEDGLYLSRSFHNGFTQPQKQFSGMGYGLAGGQWDLVHDPRKVGDVTGDGLADIIGFGRDGVWLAEAEPDFSTGQYFKPPRLWYNEFGQDAGGWHGDLHVRGLSDLNGDGILDVMGFGEEGLYGHPSPRCLFQDPCDPAANPHLELAGLAEDTLVSRHNHAGEPFFFTSFEAFAYPNPTTGLTHIELRGTPTGPVRVHVTNSQGIRLDELTQTVAPDALLRLDLDRFPSGMYFVDARQGGKRAVVKLIKH